MSPSRPTQFTNGKGRTKAYFKSELFFHRATQAHAVTRILLLAKNPTETETHINLF